METSYQIIDGNKAASFDGLVLEVLGINGSSDSKRVAINALEMVSVAPADEEWMFVVKTAIGGFGVVISSEKKAEWEHLAEEVMKAHTKITAT